MVKQLPESIIDVTSPIRIAGRRSIIIQGQGDNETLPVVLSGKESGTIVRAKCGVNTLYELVGVENITFKDISFHGPGKGTKSEAIRLLTSQRIDTSSIRFIRCSFSCFGTAIALSERGANNVDCSTIDDCTFRTCDVGIDVRGHQAVGWDLRMLRFINCNTGILCSGGGGFRLGSSSFGLAPEQIGIDLQYVTDAISLEHCTFECQDGSTALRSTAGILDPRYPANIIRVSGGRIDHPGQAVDWRSTLRVIWDAVRVCGPTELPGEVR